MFAQDCSLRTARVTVISRIISINSTFQVKNSTEAKVLCMTSIGLLHLHADKLDDTKVKSCVWAEFFWADFAVVTNKLVEDACIIL